MNLEKRVNNAVRKTAEDVVALEGEFETLIRDVTVELLEIRPEMDAFKVRTMVENVANVMLRSLHRLVDEQLGEPTKLPRRVELEYLQATKDRLPFHGEDGVSPEELEFAQTYGVVNGGPTFKLSDGWATTLRKHVTKVRLFLEQRAAEEARKIATSTQDARTAFAVAKASTGL